MENTITGLAEEGKSPEKLVSFLDDYGQATGFDIRPFIANAI
jgi:hypothetical protein